VKEVLTLILAGGKGTRLEPLTRDRAKPAVPFGGLYRIIDFTLSNCINSDLRHLLVLTQYKARSLDRHIAAGWSFLSRELEEYIGRIHRGLAATAAHRRELVQGHRGRYLPEHLHH
jgi:glucose-1-phosphate adenylyltransferase